MHEDLCIVWRNCDSCFNSPSTDSCCFRCNWYSIRRECKAIIHYVSDLLITLSFSFFYPHNFCFQIKLDITRQLLNLGLPVEFSASKRAPFKSQEVTNSPRTAESSPRRATSPRKLPSSGSRSFTHSPRGETSFSKSSVSSDNFSFVSVESATLNNSQSSPVKGIKPLIKRPSLGPIQDDLHLDQPVRAEGSLTMPGMYQVAFFAETHYSLIL